MNLKESEKKDKYLDLARELKKLWNMKVTIVPIVIGALGTITKGLLKDLEDLEVGGRVETIQTTALLRTARIRRRVLETYGDSKVVNNNNNNNNCYYPPCEFFFLPLDDDLSPESDDKKSPQVSSMGNFFFLHS